MNSLRILLAHELTLPRAALRLLLENEGGTTIAAEADNARRVQEQLRTHRVDVVLMAVSQRAGLGSALIETLQRQDSKTRVIALSPHNDFSFVRLLMAAGAAGYVSEHSTVAELKTALQEVSQGNTYIDSSISEQTDPQMVARIKAAEAGQKPPPFLSKRESEVLRMLARGFTNQQVADALSLSVKTAETYRVRLTRKLGVKSRAELFRYAFEVGMVGPDELVSG